MPNSNTRATVAGRPRRLLPVIAVAVATLAIIALDAGRQVPWLAQLLYIAGGSFLVAEAQFLGAMLAAWTRAHATKGGEERRVGRGSLDPANEGLSLVLTLSLCVGAAIVSIRSWQTKEPIDPAALTWITGTLVAAVFPLLAAERHFAIMSSGSMPESRMLAGACRLLIFTLLALAAACAGDWFGFGGVALSLKHMVAVVVSLVALELFVRSLVRWYAIPVAQSERVSHAESSLIAVLRLQRPDFAALSGNIARHSGFDLGRSWALSFLRRALLPALAALLVFGWLLSGVSALGSSERAVYESFGRPVAVLHPGLHVHLPWPLGVLRPVEFGEVREVPIAFPADDGTPAETPAPVSPADSDIEGVPPSTVDRLWDASHPSEASYLVASLANGKQNFEVINIDLRVMYRVGLSDREAQEAAYNVAAPEEVIRATAGQMLARYFARLTVLDVLGENREAFIRAFQTELQSRLTHLSTGVEVMGVVVEAIHPPPAAAPAYQGVQTAAIRSVTRISEARAEAVQTINSAQSAAGTLHNEATAAAAEREAAAQMELALFAGDREAHRLGGPAFLLERRLQRFDQVLKRTRFTIVDHRIEKTNAPVLDLRPAPFSPDTFATPPEPDER